MRLTDFVKVQDMKEYWRTAIGYAWGTGENKDSALQELKTKIERAFDGDYSPYIISYRSFIGSVWRAPECWNFAILYPENTTQGSLLHTLDIQNTKEEAISRLHLNLAQIAWNGTEESCFFIENEHDQEQFKSWARWQIRYTEIAEKQIQAGKEVDTNAICEQLREEGL